MTERYATTKAELLADTEKSWSALNTALDRLTAAQLTTIHDAEGWSVTDHIVHLTAWERSVLVLLRGQPRHLGLGVEAELFRAGDEDAVNAAVQAQQRGRPLADVLAEFRDVHAQLLRAVELLAEADLHRRYRELLPLEAGAGDDRKLYDLLYGNTADHFTEHLGWIETLVHKTR